MTTPTAIALALDQARAQGLPREEAEYLLLHALGQDTSQRAWLRAHDTDAVPDTALGTFQAHCQRRLAGEPVAYLTGTKAFHGMTLAVDARVLDPRPDTETLVDWALDLMPADQALAVADLGTGSGAIALAVARLRPLATVWAVDASADALAVAMANAHRLGLPVRGLHGHWTRPLAEKGIRVDVLVSNPPYIAEHDPHLPALVHEPLQALVSGPDGLDDIRAIVAAAPQVLQPWGWLLLEHGHDQSTAVAQLLAQQGFVHVRSRNDLAGTVRCTGAQWPGSVEHR